MTFTLGRLNWNQCYLGWKLLNWNHFLGGLNWNLCYFGTKLKYFYLRSTTVGTRYIYNSVYIYRFWKFRKFCKWLGIYIVQKRCVYLINDQNPWFGIYIDSRNFENSVKNSVYISIHIPSTHCNYNYPEKKHCFITELRALKVWKKPFWAQ